VSKDGGNVAAAVAAVQELLSLEARTVVAEVNVLGPLRERIAPLARCGENVQTKYRRFGRKTDKETEQSSYLPDGFPSANSGASLTALLIVDYYGTIQLPSPDPSDGAEIGQYTGERLYLTKEKRWVFAERVGTYSEEAGSSSQWDAECRVISDRAVIERYSLETVADSLNAATDKILKEISPRLEALKERASRAAKRAQETVADDATESSAHNKIESTSRPAKDRTWDWSKVVPKAAAAKSGQK
jgi:hypothetical protein